MHTNKLNKTDRSFDTDNKSKTCDHDAAVQFNDNRPNITAQLKLQEMANAYTADQSPIQTKENNTGLPDKLKAGIEHLSGYTMDDVKVYYNSPKPTQLQAHAYAQGTDIHIASGQEKHLPHEAWHVVQQKQGRVQATKQLKEKVNISDDAGLEREADVMGRLSLTISENQSETLQLDRDKSNKQKPLQLKGASSNLIQRKVGFEWEVDSINIVEVTKRGDRQEPSKLPSKGIAFKQGGVKLEVDSGHGEFVTEPANTLEQLNAQLEIIGHLIRMLQTNQAEGIYLKSPTDVISTDGPQKGGVWMEKGSWINVKLNGRTATGTMQATIGIPSDAEGAIRYELEQSMQHLGQSDVELYDEMHRKIKSDTSNVSAKVANLISLVIYFVESCKSGSPRTEDGPKTWMPLLIRTDFRSIFKNLNPVGEQDEFIRWIQSYGKETPLCPNGYTTREGHNKGPTINEWLNSIVAGRKDKGDRHKDKDLMSPPPGFPQHLTDAAKTQDEIEKKPVENPIPYAMGLLEMDNNLIVAEHRFPVTGKIGYEKFVQAARDFAITRGYVEQSKQDLPTPPESKPLPPLENIGHWSKDKNPEDRGRQWYTQLLRAATEGVEKHGKGMVDVHEVLDKDIPTTLALGSGKFNPVRISENTTVLQDTGYRNKYIELKAGTTISLIKVPNFISRNYVIVVLDGDERGARAEIPKGQIKNYYD